MVTLLSLFNIFCSGILILPLDNPLVDNCSLYMGGIKPFRYLQNNRFWSPILILLVFRSYYNSHPVSAPKIFHSLPWFYLVFILVLILFLAGVYLDLHPISISISILMLLVSQFHNGPDLISILVLLWYWTAKTLFYQKQKNVSSLVFHDLKRTSLTLSSVALHPSPPSSRPKSIP